MYRTTAIRRMARHRNRTPAGRLIRVMGALRATHFGIMVQYGSAPQQAETPVARWFIITKLISETFQPTALLRWANPEASTAGRGCGLTKLRLAPTGLEVLALVILNPQPKRIRRFFSPRIPRDRRTF